MNLCTVALLVSIFPAVSIAQQTFQHGSAAGILDSTWLDPVNLVENPAAASNISSLECSVFAGRYKDVQGLSFLSAGFATPFSKLVFGFVVHQTNTVGYKQNNLNLLFAKDLGGIRLGLDFHSKFISVQSIGGSYEMDVGIGVTKSSGQLSFGASVSGLGLINQKYNPEHLRPIRVSSQCIFKASDFVSVGMIASKQAGQSVSIQPAVYYRAGIINFSMGFDSLVGSFFLQTGWRFKAFEVRMLLGYQAALGLINGVEFLYKRTK